MPCRHADLSLDPQRPGKAREWNDKPRARQTPGAHWPSRQAERLNFRFSKRLCPKNYSRQPQRKTTSTEALPQTYKQR